MMNHNLEQPIRDQLLNQLTFLYGPGQASNALKQLITILDAHSTQPMIKPTQSGDLTEKDIILITYGDQVQDQGKTPLKSLADFLHQRLDGLISTVHLLPFFPYSSDDGFSIIDYQAVDPALGDWADVDTIASSFRLMLDAVINHISSRSEWFDEYKRGEPQYTDFFITVDPSEDLSQVVRPRDLPLLTEVETVQGTKHVWTTFSEDQIDLNYANPNVLLRILDLLLFYVRQGAQIIRLDAIAFLWKEIGTPSIHLPQTHTIIKVIRTILEAVAPWVYILTETNVPHEENLSYFGKGSDEAHLVYQFALPPLVLHALLSGDASRLTDWAANLETPSSKVTFFNFLASHDGIGLRPAQEVLSAQEIEDLVAWTKSRNGDVSYRLVGEGLRQPYELNITYLDALSDSAQTNSASDDWISRYLASQAIMLSLAGVPGIYFHSLFGSQNDLKGVSNSGHARAINREKLNFNKLEEELSRSDSLRARVFHGYAHLIKLRRSQPAFNPYAEQEVLRLGSNVFAHLRWAPTGSQRILCMVEMTGRPTRIDFKAREGFETTGKDLLTQEHVDLQDCTLEPYQVRWVEMSET